MRLENLKLQDVNLSLSLSLSLPMIFETIVAGAPSSSIDQRIGRTLLRLSSLLTVYTIITSLASHAHAVCRVARRTRVSWYRPDSAPEMRTTTCEHEYVTRLINHAIGCTWSVRMRTTEKFRTTSTTTSLPDIATSRSSTELGWSHNNTTIQNTITPVRSIPPSFVIEVGIGINKCKWDVDVTSYRWDRMRMK